MCRVKDRVEGVLLGLAAGDRNGGPIQMAVRLAESLVELNDVNVDDIGARYMDWWREGAFDTGPTVANVFTLVDSGLTFQAAAKQVHTETGEQTAGCNPAHRSTPLAMMPAPPTTARWWSAVLVGRVGVSAALATGCSSTVRSCPVSDRWRRV